VQEALNAAEETETITVDDFPGFVSDNTRVDGAPTEKTAWETDDVIYIKVDGAEKYATLTYNANESKWVASDDLSIKSGQSYEATYAPNYELNEGQTELVLKDGAVASTGEYLTCTGKRPIRIKFSRQYSRLRIYCGTQDASDATAAATPITVTFGTGFTPNDASLSTTFSLTPDKGNAYVYGSWKEGTKLSVEPSDLDPASLELTSYINVVNENIKSKSVAGKAYAVEPSEQWLVYNFDKANSERDWAEYTDKRIKVIGTWISMQKFNNCLFTDIDLSAVKSAEILMEEFSFSTNLKSVILPEGLKIIPDYCFDCCRSLTKVIIPSTVTHINPAAFHYCSSLSTVICRASDPPLIASDAFESSSNSKVLYVPDDYVKAYIDYTTSNSSATTWSAVFGEDNIKPISAIE
jgi:hypothetical protein